MKRVLGLVLVLSGLAWGDQIPDRDRLRAAEQELEFLRVQILRLETDNKILQQQVEYLRARLLNEIADRAKCKALDKNFHCADSPKPSE